MYKPKLTFKPLTRGEIRNDADLDMKYADLLHIPTREELIARFRSKDRNTIRPKKEITNNQHERGFEVFNEDWLINEVGDLHYRHHYYPIDARDLKEELIKHLMQKKWFDANTFMPAYFEGQFRWEFHNEQKEEQQ